MTTPTTTAEPCADCPPPACGWCEETGLVLDRFGICAACQAEAAEQFEDLASTVNATAEEDMDGHPYVGRAALLAGALIAFVNDTAQPWNRTDP